MYTSYLHDASTPHCILTPATLNCSNNKMLVHSPCILVPHGVIGTWILHVWEKNLPTHSKTKESDHAILTRWNKIIVMCVHNAICSVQLRRLLQYSDEFYQVKWSWCILTTGHWRQGSWIDHSYRIYMVAKTGVTADCAGRNHGIVIVARVNC